MISEANAKIALGSAQDDFADCIEKEGIIWHMTMCLSRRFEQSVKDSCAYAARYVWFKAYDTVFSVGSQERGCMGETSSDIRCGYRAVHANKKLTRRVCIVRPNHRACRRRDRRAK